MATEEIPETEGVLQLCGEFAALVKPFKKQEITKEDFVAKGQEVLSKINELGESEFEKLFINDRPLYGKTMGGLLKAGLVESQKQKRKAAAKKKANKKKQKQAKLQESTEPQYTLEDLGPFDPSNEKWMNHQPTINLMTIGHVANGKSTTMRAFSSEVTMRHTTELKGNMTKFLGYTSFKIFQVEGVPAPECYVPQPSTVKKYVDEQGRPGKLIRHISFLDNPGHQAYMKQMLVGASVADGALLIIAANAQRCPARQTEEHLKATTMLGIENVIVAQNKIDLVEPNVASGQYEQIVNFLRRTVVGNAPVVPICAETKINIDALCSHMVTRVKIPERNLTNAPFLQVIRSFDVNKPQEITSPEDFHGGVAGCTLIQGMLSVGDVLEIRPGLVTTEGISPIEVVVESLSIGKKEVKFVAPGCNVGVGLNVDPYITKQDSLVGHVLGAPGTLPPIFKECVVQYSLMRQIVGAQDKQRIPKQLVVGDTLYIAIGAMSVEADVVATDMPIHFQDSTQDEEYSSSAPKTRRGTAHLRLKFPVCCHLWTKILLTKQVDNSWRLIGCGRVRMTKPESIVSVQDITFNQAKK